MRSLFDELNTELRELRQFVYAIKDTQKQQSGKILHPYLTIRKRFDYAAFTVTLYRTLEKFVEELVETYAQELTEHKQYDTLPEKLQHMHLNKTIEILFNSLKESSRHSGINKKTCVCNLYKCLENLHPYSLNVSALSAHALNIRKNVIDDLFSAVGIEGIWNQICSSKAMKRWYSVEYNIVDEKRLSTCCDARLNRIVDRRNHVTHYVRLPDNICSNDEMRHDIFFIKCICSAIYHIVVENYLKLCYIDTDTAYRLQLTQKQNVLHGGYIVNVLKPTCRLYVGQPVFVLPPSAPLRWGHIIELQVDYLQTKEVSPFNWNIQDVGIHLSLAFPRNTRSTQFFVLDVPDSSIWR